MNVEFYSLDEILVTSFLMFKKMQNDKSSAHSN